MKNSTYSAKVARDGQGTAPKCVLSKNVWLKICNCIEANQVLRRKAWPHRRFAYCAFLAVAVLNGKPPIELTESDEPSDVEDSCIRARRAEDFSQPPELPPKLRSKSSTAPRNTGSTPPPQIFNVGDKVAQRCGVVNVGNRQ